MNLNITVDSELEEESLLLADAGGDIKVPPWGLRRVELEVVWGHHRVEGRRVFLEGKSNSYVTNNPTYMF